MGNISVLQKRFISIDYGKKRIGIAVSDPLNITARGLCTLLNDDSFDKKFTNILIEYTPQAIILGMPYMLSGDMGDMAIEVQNFAKMIESKYNLPIIFWDESYTSKTAIETMISSGMKKKKRAKKENVDRIASAILLQNYLDLRNDSPPERQINSLTNGGF
jgi:putative Holliday junction resolvase